MQALIPVVDFQIGDAMVPAVNARELHVFLGVGKMFSHWIKERIEQYGFVEKRDFEVLPKRAITPSQAVPARIS